MDKNTRGHAWSLHNKTSSTFFFITTTVARWSWYRNFIGVTRVSEYCAMHTRSSLWYPGNDRAPRINCRISACVVNVTSRLCSVYVIVNVLFSDQSISGYVCIHIPFFPFIVMLYEYLITIRVAFSEFFSIGWCRCACLLFSTIQGTNIIDMNRTWNDSVA